MQQPPQMIPMVPSFPPTNITTEQIQKYLDENKKLILAIMENQNLGKLAECAQYQALLQKNLMYLAAIADAQPQASTAAPQMTPHPAMQPPGYFMQHPQAAAAAMQQQPTGVFPPRAPFQFSNTQQPQDPHQQAMLAQTGFRPMGVGQGMHAMHTEAGPGSSGAATGGTVPGGNKPDGSDDGPAGADGKEGK